MCESFSVCDKYGMSLNKVNGIISKYDSFESLIDSQNNQYVKMKMIDDMEYLDNILKDTDTMLQKIKDSNCKLTECIFLGGASKINDYIYQFTDQPERKVKKEEIRKKKVGEYRVKVYNECIDDVLKILREEKVDSDIIGRIIGLKEENQG